MLKCYLSIQLKFFQGSLSHFVHARLIYIRRHCERSEAIQEIFYRFYRLLRRVAPRNDGKCAALSLAALKDFVSEANKTYVHLIEAIPKAVQKMIDVSSFLVPFFLL